MNDELFKTIRLLLILAAIAGVAYLLFLADFGALSGLIPAGTGLLAFITGRMGKDTGRLNGGNTSERLDSMDSGLAELKSAVNGLYAELTEYEERTEQRFRESQSVAERLTENIQSGKYTVRSPVDSDRDDDIPDAIELGWEE